jgi:transposase
MDQARFERRGALLALTKTDADAVVRHRAHVLVVSLDHPTRHAAATACGVSGRSITRWWARFLAGGRDGLADRPRLGRPAKLPEAARVLLRTALAQSPDAYGYPVTVWTIADLTDLLAHQGWEVSAVTVNRTVHALGYVYRRPRHDLRHRQDQEAVASARHTLETLQKKGLIAPAESASSILTSASFTPIPTWSRSGSSAASQPASRCRNR